MTPLIIFVTRTFGILLGTVRIQFIAEHKKGLAALYGFNEMVVFCISIGYTIKDFTWVNVFAYAFGMAVGTYLGMYFKEKYEIKRSKK